MWNEDSRQKINICNQSGKKYQQKYYEHILGMPTDQISWKLFDTTRKEERRDAKH
jgi:hypothetical protein